MSERPSKGDLVGFYTRSDRWGTRVGVVVGENPTGKVLVADRNKVRELPVSQLNMVMPGFVESPLPPALERKHGLTDE